MIYWRRHTDHYEDISEIKRYLFTHGELVHTGNTAINDEIKALYCNFCEQEYNNDWQPIDEDVLYVFSVWMEDRSEEINDIFRPCSD